MVNEKVKIAHYVPYFLCNNNNGEVYGKVLAVYNLCEQLAIRGHDVSVFTFSTDQRDYCEVLNNIKVYSYGAKIGYKTEQASLKIFFESLKYDVDLVHVHSGISISLLAGCYYAMKKKKPLVITWHGDSLKEKEYNRYTGLIAGLASFFYQHFLAKYILNHADSIISVSRAYISKSKFLKQFSDKIVIIPNGISSDITKAGEIDKDECKKLLGLNKHKVVLFMSSLYPLKGPHILLQAIRLIIKKRCDIIFIFAGGGEIDKYRKMADDLEVQNYVAFIGYIKKEKYLYLKAADIFVLPSLFSGECFPLVNLEAMACGVPVVASDIGGVSDIVRNGVNGILVQPGSSEDLAQALLELINNEKLCKQMGQNGLSMVQDYKWDIIAANTEQLYREVLRK